MSVILYLKMLHPCGHGIFIWFENTKDFDVVHIKKDNKGGYNKLPLQFLTTFIEEHKRQGYIQITPIPVPINSNDFSQKFESILRVTTI